MEKIDKEQLKAMLRELLPELMAEGVIGTIKGGEHTFYLTNDELHLAASTPKVKLEGSEASAMNLSLRENAGYIEIYDEAAAAVRTKWSGTDGKRNTPLIDETEVSRPDIGALLAALYGDGSDGAITESTANTRSGIIFPTTYNDGGYTITVNDKCLAIIAQSSITLSGTIDASGQGGAGGAGGAGGSAAAGSAGSVGSAGELIGASGTGGAGGAAGTTPGAGAAGGTGAGGGGGATTTYAGGAGADAKAATNSDMAHFYPNSSYEDIMKLVDACGSGGSGGGGGAGEGTGDTGGAGGNGGAGGGCVILCAPEITISSTIDVSGAAGSAGGAGAGTNAGGGGGGAGGNGGIILIITAKLTESTPTYTVSGGSGGTAGALLGTAGDGGAGGAGADGLAIKLVKS